MNKQQTDVLDKDVRLFMKIKNHIEYISIYSRSILRCTDYKVVVDCKMNVNKLYGWRGWGDEMDLIDCDRSVIKTASKTHSKLLNQISDYNYVGFYPEDKYRFASKVESECALETISNVISKYVPSVKLNTKISKHGGYNHDLGRVRKEHLSDLYMEKNYKHYFEWDYNPPLNEHNTFSHFLADIKRTKKWASERSDNLREAIETMLQYETKCNAAYKKAIIGKIQAGTKLTKKEITQYDGFVDAYMAYNNIMSYVREGNKSIDEVAEYIKDKRACK